MAGPACKVIINQQIAALTRSIERILLDPNINMGKIPEIERKRLIQELADIDLRAFNGSSLSGASLLSILIDLESYGLISPDVWTILRRPDGMKANKQGGKGDKDIRDKERGELHDD